MVDVKVKRLTSTATIPTKGSEGAAAFDLYADDSIAIWGNSTVKIPTNIAIQIPEGYFGGIYARSGLAMNSGLRPATCVSVIDSDFRGNVIVPLHNDTEHVQRVNAGDRVAQLVIQPCPNVKLVQVDELDAADRGNGGFGSTGV